MKYRAFLSYSRKDDKVAKWLWNRLERYRTPKDLIGLDGQLGPVPNSLHKIFRDKSDLGSGGHLRPGLHAALSESERLIVLCTPSSASSTWVNEEVETFIRLGREDRIFPVIGGGEPDSDDPNIECFPPALRGRGILAADLREIQKGNGHVIGDGRNVGCLKLISGMLGLPLDAIAKREQRRQQRLVAALSIAALMFAVLAVTAVGFGWLAQVRAIAERQASELAALNEIRALKGEAEALENARIADERAKSEARERNRADAEADRATENAQEASRQAILASLGERRARDTLHRFFATQAWAQFEKGAYTTATRYALAGLQLSPGNERLYRSALAGIIHEARPPDLLYVPNPTPSFSAMSPDGRYILAPGPGTSGLVRDTITGNLVARFDGHTEEIGEGGFNGDGSIVATSDNGGQVIIWDSPSSKIIASFTPDSILGSPSVWLSPDGRRVFTSTGVQDALWESQTGQLIKTIEGSGGGPPKKVVFSPDSRLILLVNWDRTARVWNTADGRIVSKLDDSENGIADGSFSHDSSRIITGGYGGKATVWRASDGQKLASFADHSGTVSKVQFSPNSTKIVTAGRDGHANIWDSSDYKLTLKIPAHEWGITAVDFNESGTHFATSAVDRVVSVWSAADGKLFSQFSGSTATIFDLRFIDGGTKVVALADDGTLRSWRDIDGQSRLFFKGRYPLDSATFDPHSEGIGVVGTPSGVRNAKDGKLSFELLGRGVTLINSLVFNFDGSQIVTAESDRTAKIWNAKNGNLELELAGHRNAVYSAEFSPDGSLVVTASGDGVAMVWDSKTGTVANTLLGHDEALWSASFNSAGNRIITASNDQTARIWMTETGTLLTELSGHSGAVLAGVFSPDGKLAATASVDQTAKIWNAKSGTLIATLQGHEGKVNSIAFSRDGKKVFTASDDTTVRAWDGADGKPIAVLKGHEGRVGSVSLSPDGNTLITASADGSIRLWDVGHIVADTKKLTRIACERLLGSAGRYFHETEISADQLLMSEWQQERDLCKGIL